MANQPLSLAQLATDLGVPRHRLTSLVARLRILPAERINGVEFYAADDMDDIVSALVGDDAALDADLVATGGRDRSGDELLALMEELRARGEKIDTHWDAVRWLLRNRYAPPPTSTATTAARV